MKVKVEILRVSIDDVRVGPDLGPWTVIAGPFSGDHVPVLQQPDAEDLAQAIWEEAAGFSGGIPPREGFVDAVRRALKRW